MNKRKVLGLVSGVVLMSSGSSFAADVDLEIGMDAARQGYYDYAASVFGSHADKGNGDAQFNIALMYHSGLGVARDEGQALEWYERAAENGHEMAQAYLAAGYAEGWFGLEKNAQKARYWSEKLPVFRSTVEGELRSVNSGNRSFGWGSSQ